MITDDTLASLRTNDDRLDNLFLYLDDFSLPPDDDDENDEISAALQGNTRVTAVDCDMHLDTMTVALSRLMTGIGHLTNLQRLRCSSSGNYAVTMAAMAKALQATTDSTTSRSQLVSLDLANFLLQDNNNNGDNDRSSVGVESDVDPVTAYHDFVHALRHHPSLQNFNLGFGFSSSSSSNSNLNSITEQDEAHLTLTPLLQALQTIPTLDYIRLDGAAFARPRALTPQGLTALLSSNSSVTTLEVQDFALSPEHLEVASRALATNTQLKNLSLACHQYDYNGKSSEDTANKPPRRRPAPVKAMAQALRTNTTLEELCLPQQILFHPLQGGSNNPQSKKPSLDLAAMVEFLQAVEVHPTLQKLQLTTIYDHASPQTIVLSQDVKAAFRHMLQHNYRLESVSLPPWFDGEEWQAEIQLHTKLNAMGRGRLVRGASLSSSSGGGRTSSTNHQWMEALGQVQDDLSCLFHLLLLNPLLCEL